VGPSYALSTTRTVTKNNNHARYYKTTPHVDFFNLYGGEPTDEGAIS
jgi:hypothetical protein